MTKYDQEDMDHQLGIQDELKKIIENKDVEIKRLRYDRNDAESRAGSLQAENEKLQRLLDRCEDVIANRYDNAADLDGFGRWNDECNVIVKELEQRKKGEDKCDVTGSR